MVATHSHELELGRYQCSQMLLSHALHSFRSLLDDE